MATSNREIAEENAGFNKSVTRDTNIQYYNYNYSLRYYKTCLTAKDDARETRWFETELGVGEARVIKE